MSDSLPASAPPDQADPAERSLADDLRQLADDARALADAELAYQKTRAAFAGKGIRTIAVLAALAAALLFFALMALTFGLVLALATELGPWGAAGAVFGGFVAIALVSLIVIMARWKRLTALLNDKDAGT